MTLSAAGIMLAASAESLTLRPGKVEVVASDADAPAVRFAVAELTNFLSRTLGASVPARSAPSGGAGVVAIRLGGAQAKEAGVDVATFAHDEFLTRVDANGVLIAGRDNPRYDLPRAVREGQGYAPLIGYGTEEDAERATLLGVYDFLERYAGVRFYLPDELGTIVPRTGEIAVPFGDGRTKPNFLIREPYMGGDGKWPVLNPADPQDDERRRTLLWLRQRHSTTLIPCCHGSQHFKYIQRFAKTHPEYLALKQDGSRWDDLGVFAANQFCWSDPGFRETLYQDTKAYLTGAPASSRGLAHWGYNCKFHRYVDIMPEDSFSDCHCARCQAAYVRRPGDTHYATELIWGVTAQLAQRLIDEGVAGSVTQMAYEPYGRVPDFALPTNVQVMVARTGPWSMAHPEKVAAEERHFRAWSEKLGHRVWAWTYPQKFGRTAIKGVPCLAPRAWGEYFKRMSPWIFGSFVECESDKSIYNHLNYYVFSRVAWDAHVDVEAVLREYHELMFGAGAADMAKFNRILEEKWLNDVAGRIEETSLGPIAKVPSAYQLWHDVYSPAVRAELQACLRKATEKTPPDSSERRRIALMKREFYDPLVQEAEAFESATDLRHGLALRAKEPNRSILSDDWKDWNGNFEVDTSTFVTPPSSVRFSGTNTAAVAFPLQGRAGKSALKPNTRYRLTYFVKTEDVEPRAMYGGGGGIAVNVYDDHNRWFPDRNFFTGTMGWIFQSYEFTSGPNTNDPAKGADARSYLWLHRLNAAGTAWFDDVRLEEIKEEK